MSKWILAAASLAFATPAWCDLTAPELWEEWVALQAAQGIQMEAFEQTYENGVLRLKGIETQQRDERGSVIGRMDQIVLTERGGDRVTFSTSENYVVTSASQIGDDHFVLPYVIGLQNFRGEVVGSMPRAYSFEADGLSLQMEGQQPDMRFSVDLEAGPLTGNSTVSAGTEGPFEFSQAMTFDSADVAAKFYEGQTEQALQFEATFSQVSSESSGSYGGTPETSIALPLGFAMDLTAVLGFETGEMKASVKAPEGDFASISETQNGSLQIGYSAQEVSFGIKTAQSRTRVQLPNAERALGYTAGRTVQSFFLPLNAVAPEPYGLELVMEDLLLDDDYWTQIDPAGLLDHGPASVRLVLNGEVGNMESVNKLGSSSENVAMALDFRSLNLREFEIQMAGATLSAYGKLTTQGQGVTARPVGQLNFGLEGGYALLDGLVELGAVPSGEAMFYRMMLGGIARQTGEDSLIAEFEFHENRTVTVNGLPLPF